MNLLKKLSLVVSGGIEGWVRGHTPVGLPVPIIVVQSLLKRFEQNL